MEDPYETVKCDVSKALDNARNLFDRFFELVQESPTTTRQEREWICTEFKNTLRSIEWDIEDLEETIEIIDKNPKKFPISVAELQSRKDFVLATRKTIDGMREIMSASDGRFKDRFVPLQDAAPHSSIIESQSKAQYKYSKLRNEDEFLSGDTNANSHFLNNALSQQESIMRTQDDHLERIGDAARGLKNISLTIGNELDEHSVMLDEVAHGMSRTESKFDSVMKKLTKITHISNDRRQWCAILVLVIILLIIIMLFFIL